MVGVTQVSAETTENWRAISNALELSFDEQQTSLGGKLRGFLVRAEPLREVESVDTSAWVAVGFHPPFDLSPNDPTAIVEAGEVIRPSDARLQALLAGGAALALDRLAIGTWKVTLSDELLYVVGAGGPTTHSVWLRRMIEEAVEVALHIDQRRADIPARPELLSMAPFFEQLGTELGLSFSASPLGILGVLDGVGVTAVMRPWRGNWRLNVSASYPHPPSIKVDIAPSRRTFAERLRLRAPKDIEIGDRELDARLDIWTHHPDVLCGRMGREAREALRVLCRSGRLHVDAAGVRVDVVRNHRHARSLLEAAAEIASVLAGPKRIITPFRS